MFLAVLALLVGLGVAPSSTPPCPSHDVLAARLRAEGFPHPAANRFARLSGVDCLSART